MYEYKMALLVLQKQRALENQVLFGLDLLKEARNQIVARRGVLEDCKEGAELLDGKTITFAVKQVR